MSTPVVDTHLWRSDAPLRPSGRRTFSDLLGYCFPVGGLVSWDASGDDVVVRFTAADHDDAERIRGLLTSAHRRVAPVQAQRVPLVDIPEGEGSSWGPPPDVTEVGPGLVVGSPPIARLMRLVDDLALRMAADLGAVELSVPHLVSWSTIERAGYARTFPQHLTACETVADDLEALDRFAESAGATPDRSYMDHAPVCVSPSVCLHVFAGVAQRGAILRGPLSVTARAACGRYEGAGVSTPTRLWSFTMREIVYVGDRQGALDFRAAALGHFERLVGDIGLSGMLVAANDPFFTTQQANLEAFQSGFDLKHELVGRLPGGGEVAVSSVNVHNQHFGSGFGITTPDGEPASSACVGFGLERWAHWLHARLGPDPADWPPVLFGGGEREGLTATSTDTW